MKNLNHLRNQMMNLSLRSILASSFIAFTMMSCTKEDVRPVNINTQAYDRTGSSSQEGEKSVDAVEMNINNSQTLIDFQIEASIDEPAYRIMISSDATVSLTTSDHKGNNTFEYKMNSASFSQVLNAIESQENNNQERIFSGVPNFNISEVEYRTCGTCPTKTIHHDGDIQERNTIITLIQDVDRIIDIRGLIHTHNNKNVQK